METTLKHRRMAARLVTAAGALFLCIGLSHLVVPTLFAWRRTLPASAEVVIAGASIDNVALLHLFNADLLLYEVMLGVASLLCAPHLGRGRRSALLFSGALALFFLLRAPLQFLYFPATWPNVAQAAVALALSCMYGFPVLARRAFLEP